MSIKRPFRILGRAMFLHCAFCDQKLGIKLCRAGKKHCFFFRGGSPGKSFGLKFIPNQSDLFRNLYPSQSEVTRVNLIKVSNLVGCKSVEHLFELIRDFESE